MKKARLLSGIQPTGKLHIGNYLGALKNFVELQNSGKFDCYFCVVDLHSLTENFDPTQKKQQILDLTADFLAAGLDPKKSTVLLQSMVPAHTELYWILNTITPVSELSRMTQYKDKSARQEKNINAGLFTYPTLMAADILLYNTAPEVPIGDDQTQHLELTRILARKFNTRFGQTFIEPKGLYTKTPRIMSLANPDKKMSKSEASGCVFLDDLPEDISKKISRAVTDSGGGSQTSPGVVNLLMLLESFGGEKEAEKFRSDIADGTIRYAELKKVLSDKIAGSLAGFRKVKAGLIKNPKKLESILVAGSKKAAKVANNTLNEAKKRIGIL